MNVEKKITIFPGCDGTNLYAEVHLVSDAKGIIVLAHGYAEHCGRYGHVISHLNQAGYSVYTYDWRNHGKSPGKRGCVENFDHLVADFANFVKIVKDHSGGSPIYLMGHSCGGQIVAKYAGMQGIEHHEKGLILSGTAIEFDTSHLTLLLFEIIIKIFPKWKILPPMVLSLLSHDPAMLVAVRNDPYFYKGRVTARTGYEIVHGGKKVQANMHMIQQPMLVLCGTGDKIASPNGSKWLFEKAISVDKTFKTYDGFYHEILNEIGREQVLADITAWLKQREKNSD